MAFSAPGSFRPGCELCFFGAKIAHPPFRQAMPTCSTERRQQDHPAPSSNPWRPDWLVLSRLEGLRRHCRRSTQNPKGLGLESFWPESAQDPNNPNLLPFSRQGSRSLGSLGSKARARVGLSLHQPRAGTPAPPNRSLSCSFQLFLLSGRVAGHLSL